MLYTYKIECKWCWIKEKTIQRGLTTFATLIIVQNILNPLYFINNLLDTMCIVINMLEWCIFQSYLGIYLLFIKLEQLFDQTLDQTLLGFLTLQPLPYPYPYPSKPLTLGWGQGYEGDRVRVSLSWPRGYPCPSLVVSIQPIYMNI